MSKSTIAGKIHPLVQAIIAGLVVFFSVCICINFLSRQAQDINRQNLDRQLLIIAKNAAALVDGDKHEALIASGKTDSDLYLEMVAPLVKLHNSTPDIYYLYTMKDNGQEMVFGLDTSTSAELKSSLGIELEPSFVGDIWDVPEDQYIDWSSKMSSLGAHVDEEFSTDEFGTFLTASAPFYNRVGRMVGFVGVDIDTSYFQAYKQRIETAVTIGYLLAAGFSFVIAALLYGLQSGIKKLQVQLYADAVTDPLTKCFNRRHFNQEYARAKANFDETGTNYCIVILDIDHFKSVNDNYGHSAGDKILYEFAQSISKHSGKDSRLFRVGGEEFVLLIDDAKKETIEWTVARCFAAIHNHSFTLDDGSTLEITASIGVAEAKAHDDVLKAADESLYKAKDYGRDQIVVAS